MAARRDGKGEWEKAIFSTTFPQRVLNGNKMNSRITKIIS